jgi:uncharacterized protein (TIGR02001 family)
MNMTAKRALLPLAGLAFACLTASAFADEPAAPAPDWTYPGSVSLTSDYIFRGLTQTNKRPALQAGIEFDNASGFYAGAWGSNISWLSDLGGVSSSLEIDAYLGYRMKVAGDWGLDFGVYTYYYPGDYPSGFTNPNTTEIYGAISYGIASLKYSHSLTNTFGFSDSKNSGYIDLSANWEFVPTWVLNGHVGHQRIDGLSAASYTDWKLGVTKNLDGNWSLALAYFDTNADRSVYTNPYGTFQGRSTGVLTVTKTF